MTERAEPRRSRKHSGSQLYKTRRSRRIDALFYQQNSTQVKVLNYVIMFKARTLSDLREGLKEEYQSKAGLAMLYDRSGGKMTEEMMDVVVNVSYNNFLVLLHYTKNTNQLSHFLPGRFARPPD